LKWEEKAEVWLKSYQKGKVSGADCKRKLALVTGLEEWAEALSGNWVKVTRMGWASTIQHMQEKKITNPCFHIFIQLNLELGFAWGLNRLPIYR